MSPSLSVIEPGFGATLQDLGRPGFMALGVPASGALDPVALRIANWLAGNDGGEGAIEMRFSGPAFEVRGGPVRVALAGEDAGMRLMLAAAEEERIPAFRSVTLGDGQRFRVELRGGTACYLAVAGGFAVQPVLGSVSTLVVARLGGIDGRPLAAGDVLPLRAMADASGDRILRSPKLEHLPRCAGNRGDNQLRVILGPQDDHFPLESIAQFLRQTFTVSHRSDRMGIRLEGEALRHARGFDIISDGNAPGSVQVPGSGLPIILMADNGTTGGYSKIATIISADLPALGRLAPGTTVRFQAVTHDEAVAALRAHQAWLAGIRASIQPYHDDAEHLARALAEENIISGVTDARR